MESGPGSNEASWFCDQLRAFGPTRFVSPAGLAYRRSDHFSTLLLPVLSPLPIHAPSPPLSMLWGN